MLHTIELKNFKGFHTLDKLPIKPITILAGTNSCGKSSILQSILLLKQTIESKNPNQTLLLNGRFVHLGTFENIIYGKDNKKTVSLNFCFKISKSDLSKTRSGQIPLHFLLRDMITEKAFDEPKAEYLFKYHIDLIPEGKKKRKSLLKPIKVLKVELELIVVKGNGDKYTETSICFNHEENDVYKLEWNNLNLRYWPDRKKHKVGQSNVSVEFSNFFPTVLNFKEEKEEISSPLSYFFYRLQEIFKSISSSITYLGPLREEPARRYIYEDEIIEIGIKGENAAYIFLAEQDDKLSNTYFFDYNKNSFYLKRNCTLQEAVSIWNNAMNIKDFRSDTYNEIIQLNLSSNSAEGTRVNIADVGFGVSQIFPIVLEGLRMGKGNTLLLEQPEIHLHPNLQMQLADYFISLALSNKKIIVETHSDHIINRLVRRIVESDNDQIRNLIGIYFITATENGAEFEEVEIDETRGIRNWPKDFFDQTASEQERIIKASILKHKKNQTK